MLKTSKNITLTGSSTSSDGETTLATFNANINLGAGSINAGMTTLTDDNSDVVQADFAEFTKLAYTLKDGETDDQTETTTK